MVCPPGGNVQGSFTRKETGLVGLIESNQPNAHLKYLVCVLRMAMSGTISMVCSALTSSLVASVFISIDDLGRSPQVDVPLTAYLIQILSSTPTHF